MIEEALPPSVVVHFVTGGFSGATSVAVDLARAARDLPALGVRAVLVLRRKRSTDQSRIDALTNEGLNVHVVAGGLHRSTFKALTELLSGLKPDVLVAHGYPEHIIGRSAGLKAGVPCIVQVEHNTVERYTKRTLEQALALCRNTQHIIGVSEGVGQSLHRLGFPIRLISVIPNGVDVEKFAHCGASPWVARLPQAVMCARFSRQKDHVTLIKAAALLKARGLHCPVMLAGDGKWIHRLRAKVVAVLSGLDAQDVSFLGRVSDPGVLLGRSQLAVLSTNHEGMPLAIIEAMAAGCVVIGSDVPGVREVIDSGINGWLVPPRNAHALADAISHALSDLEGSTAMSNKAKIDANGKFSKEECAKRHHALYRSP